MDFKQISIAVVGVPLADDFAVGTLGVLVDLGPFAAVNIQVHKAPMHVRDTGLVHQPVGGLLDLRGGLRRAITGGARHAEDDFFCTKKTVVTWVGGVVVGQRTGGAAVYAAVVRAGAVVHAGFIDHPFSVVDHRDWHRGIAAFVATGPDG